MENPIEGTMYGLGITAQTGIQGCIAILTILAKRGLVSPVEIDQFMVGITKHFSSDPGPAELLFQSDLEQMYAPGIANIRRLAEQTWKGP